jgi:hypothetical protein
MKTLEDVLEEIVPTPDPDFVADMERRMQLGFPQDARRPRLARFTLPALRPRALAAVAASAMLALLVAVTLVSRDDGRRDEVAVTDAARPAGLAAAPEIQPESDSAAGGGEANGAGTAAPVPPPGEDVAPRAGNRQVERSAEITLAADPADFDALSDSIFRIAGRRNGFVLRSSFTQGEEGSSGGSFELRIPSAQLQPALGDLSRLGTVRARSESGNDVTASVVSLRDRLRTSLAERKSLLRRLELAFTDTAVNALRRRLATVGRTVAALRSQLRTVRDRTEFATVLLTLVDKDTGGAASGETDDAIDDAVGSLEDVMNFLIRALGVLIPVAFTALIVWLGASRARKRARERALA